MSMTWWNPESLSHFLGKSLSIWLKILVVKHLWAKFSSWKKHHWLERCSPSYHSCVWTTGWWDWLYWLCYEIEASCRSPWTTGSLYPGLLSPRKGWAIEISLMASAKLVILDWKECSRTSETQFTKKPALYFHFISITHWRYTRSDWAKSNRYLLSLCLSLSLRGTQILASHLSSCQVFTIVGGAESCPAISSSVVFG